MLFYQSSGNFYSVYILAIYLSICLISSVPLTFKSFEEISSFPSGLLVSQKVSHYFVIPPGVPEFKGFLPLTLPILAHPGSIKLNCFNASLFFCLVFVTLITYHVNCFHLSALILYCICSLLTLIPRMLSKDVSVCAVVRNYRNPRSRSRWHKIHDELHSQSMFPLSQIFRRHSLLGS